MKSRIFLVTLLGLIHSVGATEGIELSTTIGLSGDHVSGDKNEARTFGLSSAIEFKQSLYSNFLIDVEGGFSLETGSSETVYGAGSFKPTNTPYLGHAEMIYTPFKFSTVKLGAINQSYHNNPLFVTSTPFIGAREIFEYKVSNWTVQFDLIQSIPSNYTLSRRLGSVSEGSARFFNEKLRLIGEGNLLSLNASIGHYAFDELSPSVAYESRLLGNSVSGIGTYNNKFRYSFVGWNGDMNIDLKAIAGTTISLNSAWHLNSNAPDGKNLGYKIGPSLAIESNNRIFKLGIETFKNESDSTVAYYSSKAYGNVNRVGNAVSLKVEDLTNGLEYGAKGVQADPIVTTPYQSDERIISIFLRKSYEIF
ncbi:MAG: hypothetical protein EP326_03465 [Deltaproteobacteria bacterium]|nr:MAG: hypothetical protein EP326_03465 [Deltaproteobacteria bacterium]